MLTDNNSSLHTRADEGRGLSHIVEDVDLEWLCDVESACRRGQLWLPPPLWPCPQQSSSHQRPPEPTPPPAEPVPPYPTPQAECEKLVMGGSV
jgi:hypothetical protein